VSVRDGSSYIIVTDNFETAEVIWGYDAAAQVHAALGKPSGEEKRT
jgi:hypothetical protein